VGVQKISWYSVGTVRGGDYNFLYGKGNENCLLETGFFVHHRMLSAIKRVQFVSNKMLYILFCEVVVVISLF
jgi:hypothetical protein